MLLYVCTAIVVCGRIGSVGENGHVESVEIPQGEAERAFKDETLSKVGCDQGQGCQAQQDLVPNPPHSLTGLSMAQ